LILCIKKATAQKANLLESIVQKFLNKRTVNLVLAISWCGMVTISYLWVNVGYYSEKISAFGRFAINLIGGN